MNTSTARRQDVALLALRLQRRGIRPTVAELKAKEAIESAGIDFGRSGYTIDDLVDKVVREADSRDRRTKLSEQARLIVGSTLGGVGKGGTNVLLNESLRGSGTLTQHTTRSNFHSQQDSLRRSGPKKLPTRSKSNVVEVQGHKFLVPSSQQSVDENSAHDDFHEESNTFEIPLSLTRRRNSQKSGYWEEKMKLQHELFLMQQEQEKNELRQRNLRQAGTLKEQMLERERARQRALEEKEAEANRLRMETKTILQEARKDAEEKARAALEYNVNVRKYNAEQKRIREEQRLRQLEEEREENRRIAEELAREAAERKRLEEMHKREMHKSLAQHQQDVIERKKLLQLEKEAEIRAAQEAIRLAEEETRAREEAFKEREDRMKQKVAHMERSHNRLNALEKEAERRAEAERQLYEAQQLRIEKEKEEERRRNLLAIRADIMKQKMLAQEHQRRSAIEDRIERERRERFAAIAHLEEEEERRQKREEASQVRSIIQHQILEKAEQKGKSEASEAEVLINERALRDIKEQLTTGKLSRSTTFL